MDTVIAETIYNVAQNIVNELPHHQFYITNDYVWIRTLCSTCHTSIYLKYGKSTYPWDIIIYSHEGLFEHRYNYSDNFIERIKEIMKVCT